MVEGVQVSRSTHSHLPPSPSLESSGDSTLPHSRCHRRQKALDSSRVGKSSLLAFTVICVTDNFVRVALEGADLAVARLPEEEQDVKETPDPIRKKMNDTPSSNSSPPT